MVRNMHFLIMPPPLKRLLFFCQGHHGLDNTLELLCNVSGDVLKNKETTPIYAKGPRCFLGLFPIVVGGITQPLNPYT